MNKRYIVTNRHSAFYGEISDMSWETEDDSLVLEFDGDQLEFYRDEVAEVVTISLVDALATL
jgi:hypothetical protein